MSTAAQAILQQIEALPSVERDEVLDAALRLRERTWQEQQAKLREMQAPQTDHAEALAALARLRGSSKGKGLLAILLADRAKERARG